MGTGVHLRDRCHGSPGNEGVPLQTGNSRVCTRCLVLVRCSPPVAPTHNLFAMLAGEAKALHTTKRSSGIDVSDPKLAQAWASVKQDSDPQVNWCAFTHAEVRRNSVWQHETAHLHTHTGTQQYCMEFSPPMQVFTPRCVCCCCF